MSFDEAVRGADRVTVAVTLFALLELYKQGEATWTQDEAFGDIAIAPLAAAPAPRARRPVRRAGDPLSPLARTLEALLFLSPDPVAVADLAQAARLLARRGRGRARGAARGLRARRARPGAARARRRLDARHARPRPRPAARRLLAKPRTPPLTPAQAETLAIVAYLQPVSRPEITRIRGVSADSAAATLLERGLIEEAGRSQFGAVLYRTTPLFLKLFGLDALEDLPDPSEWDPTPEEEAELRDRLLKAGEQRPGGAPGPEAAPAAPAPPRPSRLTPAARV